MPYYLARYQGAGTDDDPCRPVDSDGQPGWSAIDLRRDGGKTPTGAGLNACLLWLQSPSSDPNFIFLGNAVTDEIGVATVTAINAKLGTQVAPGRLDNVVAALLLAPPPNGWSPVRATFSGEFEIWLNGLLSRRFAIAGGLGISENWNCANSASLTCQLTWTKFSGTGWAISANQGKLTSTTVTTEAARAEVDLITDNHQVQCTYVSGDIGQSNAFGGVICRKTSAATKTFYYWHKASAPNYSLRKQVAGTLTILGTAGTVAAGDVIKLTADGSTITGYQNGNVLVTVTDTAITGNLRCGIYGVSNNATINPILDNWSAQDLADFIREPTAPIRVRLRSY